MKRKSSGGLITAACLLVTAFVQGASPPDSPRLRAALQPIISVDPASISESLFVGGSSAHIVTINNTGDADLDWEGHAAVSASASLSGSGERLFALTAPVAPGGFVENGIMTETVVARTSPISAELGDLTGVQILWDRAHGGSPLTSWSVIMNDVTGRGATVVESFDALTSELLSGYDVLWLTDQMSEFASSEITAVQVWVRTGGFLLFECDESMTAIGNVLAGLQTGITYKSPSATTGTTDGIHSHEMTAGVATVFLPGPQDYLAIAAPAQALVEDASGKLVCAHSRVGAGGVFAVTDEVFADGIISNADNQLFGNQVIDWLSRTANWLGIAPPSGTVPAGGSQEVTVTFDASGVFGGAYDADILFRHNDPSSPDITVQTHLLVLGSSDIRLSEDAVDFGGVFVGLPAQHTISIFNDGTDPLVVSDISSSHAEFTADPSSFTVLPGKEQDVAVGFTPSSVGPFTGSLTLASDDPDEPTSVVALQGEGLDPPIISAEPQSLADSLFTGETSSHTLTVSNSGLTNLVFRLSRSVLEETAAASSLRPRARDITPVAPQDAAPRRGPFYAEGKTGPARTIPAKPLPDEMTSTTGLDILLVHTDYVYEIRNQLLAFPDISVVDAFNAQYATPTLDDLDDYDAVILVAGWEWYDPVELGNVLADYVDVGGGVIMTLASFVSPFDVRGRFAAGGYYPFTLGSGPAGGGVLSSYNENHPIMENVTWAWGDLLAQTTLAPGALEVAAWSIGQPFIATQRGRVVGINAYLADSWEWPYWAGDIPLILRNAAAWIARAPWLSFDPAEGEVPSGGSLDITVRFDAADLYGGDYGANVLISSNDPATPELEVPARLHVTGAPDIEVSETIVDFGPVFIGASAVRTLTVRNAGTDLLDVSSLSIGATEFTADPNPFSLAPFENRDIPVMFLPVSPGPIAGTLTITSNDPDEAAMDVELHGSGLEPPVVSVTPDSLADSLISGVSSLHIVTIANTGAHNLLWNASKWFSPDAARLKEYALTAPVAPATYPETGLREPPEHSRRVPISAPLQSLAHTDILWDQYHGGSPLSGWSVIVADLTARGATVTANHQAITPSLLEPYELLWLTDPLAGFASAEIDAIREWVGNGGSLLVECDQSEPALDPLLAALSTGISVDGTAAAPGVTTNIDPHETTHGLASLYLPGPQNRLHIGPPAQVLVEDTGGVAVCAAGEADLGKILVITDELFADGPIASADNQLFGNQAVDWLAGGYDWLRLDPTTGEVPPGDSQEMTVTLDAAGMYGGNYEAGILIQSNDPVRPEVAVPVRLHVTAVPDLVLSAMALEFDTTFIGLSARDTIRVHNDGTGQLVVGSISSSDPQFTADPTSLSLAPWQDQDVVVTFAPTSPGAAAAVLTFSSNDPDEPEVAVVLGGEGLVPPSIAVAPDSLAAVLFSGAAATQQLTITNQGGSDLIWSITASRDIGRTSTEYILTPPVARAAYVENGVSAATAITRTASISAVLGDLYDVRILWDREHGGSSLSGWSVILADLNARGATVVENTQAITTQLLAGYKVLWLTDPVNPAFTASEIAAVQSWVITGGALLIESDEYSSRVNALLLGLGSGITFVDNPVGPATTNKIHPHDATRNIESVYLPGPRSRLSVAPPAKPLVDDPNDVRVCAVSEIGKGRILAITDELFADGPVSNADNQLFGNQTVDWLAGHISWLQFAPTGGIVTSGSSRDVEVTFDATGMYEGDYDALIEIRSNDLDSLTGIPAHLHVDGAPDISVSASSLDFGSPFLGARVVRTFTVSNTGTDALEVTEIASLYPEITVDPTSFVLPVLGSRLVSATLVATTPGAFTSSLVISTNDPDESEVAVELTGEPLSPPGIDVAPDSLHADLLTGEQTSEMLTIRNPGASTLNFSITLVPPASSAPFSSASFAGSNALMRPKEAALDAPPAGDMEAAELVIDWLSLSVTSGQVAPGDSASVTVTFDAAEKLGAVYRVDLSINTNIPAVPRVLVPAEMVVTGIPEISVSDEALNFGDVFSGTVSTMYLTVSSIGSGILVVSDVTVDDPAFSVIPTSFNLPSYNSQFLEVKFTAAQPGDVSQLLAIHSNDPDQPVYQVALAARVMHAPVISVSADSIKAVVEEGQSRIDSVYVTNSGGSVLNWTAEVMYPASGSGANAFAALPSDALSSLRVLWHGDHGWGGGIAWWSVIISHLTSRDASVTQSNAPIDQTLLQGFDVIWLGDRSVPFSASEKSALLAWTNGGGRILIEGDGSTTAAVYNDLLETMGSSLYFSASPARTGLTASIHPHDITYGIDEVFLVSAANILYVFPPAVPLVDDLLGSGRTVIACEVLGGGKLVILADHTLHDVAINSSDNLGLASQVFEWLGLPRWLSLAPGSGTLAPEESALIEVTSDAANLATGLHRLDVVVHSNDPARPSATLPVLLTVRETGTGMDPGEKPARFELHANYPNPFNPTTTIVYDLPVDADVHLAIYDVRGRKVRELVDASRPAGRHVVTWNGRDSSGEPVATGVYFYRLASGDFERTRKMILLK